MRSDYLVQRTVVHCGRTVLAMDYALTGAQQRRRPAAEQNRWVALEV